jgi:hypothetical protein
VQKKSALRLLMAAERLKDNQKPDYFFLEAFLAVFFLAVVFLAVFFAAFFLVAILFSTVDRGYKDQTSL